MESSYLRFLRLKDTLIEKNKMSLDASSKDILEYIFKNIIHNKNEIMVGNVLALKQFGSLGTLHKRLHILVREGYLKLESTNDGRVKQVQLTKKANQYFDSLNRALETAVKV